MMRWIGVLLVAGCGGAVAQGGESVEAGAPGAGPWGEPDFAWSELPARNVEVDGDALVVWGVTEVPAGARRQAAFKMIDTITRGELATFLRAEVESEATDVMQQVDGTFRQQVALRSAEVAQAALSGDTTSQRSWRAVEREGKVWMQLVGRLRLGQEVLQEALGKALGDGAAAEAIVRALFAPAQAKAQAPASRN